MRHTGAHRHYLAPIRDRMVPSVGMDNVAVHTCTFWIPSQSHSFVAPVDPNGNDEVDEHGYGNDACYPGE